MKKQSFKMFTAVIVITAIMTVALIFWVNVPQTRSQERVNPSNFIFNTTLSVEMTMTETTAKPRPASQWIVSNRFEGRLGNLMFEFASSYGIARHNNMQYQIDCSSSEAQRLRSVFKQISYTPCIQDTTGFIHHGLPWGNFQSWTLEFESKNQNVMLSGYMQSYKYFWPFRREIRELFPFDSLTTVTAHSVLKDARNKTQDSTLIGVHVRRGDYLSPVMINHGYNLPDGEYFRKAFAYFRVKYPRVVFLVVSEDLDWCRQNMNGTDIVFFTSGDPITDMCLVSNADHAIISVGTYGWWSAFLCEGQVLYYRDIARPGSSYSTDLVTDDFFPNEWIAF